MLNSVVNAMLAGCTQHDGTLDSLWICGSLGHLLDQSWMEGWVDGRLDNENLKKKKSRKVQEVSDQCLL